MSYISGFRQGVGKELASPKHTLSSSLSMPRVWLEAGKKQPKRSLEYGYSMEKMLLYPSFGVPLVLLGATFGGTEDVCHIHGESTEVTRRMYVGECFFISYYR